jgi:hypothetical protein
MTLLTSHDPWLIHLSALVVSCCQSAQYPSGTHGSPDSLALYQANARAPMPLSLTELSQPNSSKHRSTQRSSEAERVLVATRPQLKVKTDFSVPKDKVEDNTNSVDRRILQQQLKMAAWGSPTSVSAAKESEHHSLDVETRTI